MCLCINLNLIAGKCIGCAVDKFNFAANDGSAYVDGPDFIAFSVFGIHPNIITHSVSYDYGQFPSSDGHGNEHSLSRRIVFAGTSNGNGCNVLVLIGNNVRSGEALGNFHMIKLPTADVVKINIGTYRLNLFNIGCNKINVIE